VSVRVRAGAAVFVAAVAGTALRVAAAPAETGPARPASASARLASAPSAPASAAAVKPIDFAGSLEPGMAYVGELVYDANALRTWRPAKDVVVPPNSTWTIRWKNLEQFAVLKTASARARPQRAVFRVLSADIHSGSPRQPWTVTYQGELVSVEPATVASKAPARRH
jgi:hypothetical protein